MSCAAPPTGTGFLSATLEHLDCQAQTIGEAGYLALSDPSSPLALALTALLSIFVAIIGIRFLMGRPMGANDLIAAILKVGFVLAIAASWPAYRTVVYDVVLKGPAEVAGSIGRASALPGSDGELSARLQGVDTGIMALVQSGSGRLDISSRRSSDDIAPPLTDDTTLGWGKTFFISGILGSFGLLRLSGGLFLALAPLFAGFLLFEATRFLFFGWLRSLIAIALGSVGIAIVLGVELAIIEPWLSQVLTLRAARVATLSAPFELLALSLSFAVVMIGVLALAARIGFASDVVLKVQTVIERTAQSLQNNAVLLQHTLASNSENIREQTRAQILAQSVNQTLHREATAGLSLGGSGAKAARSSMPMATVAASRQENNIQLPLGRSYHTPSRRIGSQALKRKPAT